MVHTTHTNDVFLDSAKVMSLKTTSFVFRSSGRPDLSFDSAMYFHGVHIYIIKRVKSKQYAIVQSNIKAEKSL